MFTKIGAAVLGALLVLGLGASAGANTGYTPEAPDSSVSSSTVAVGGTLTFTAGGFQPNRAVTVSVTRSDIGAGGSGNGFLVIRTAAVGNQSVTADSAGAVSVPVKVGRSGVYTITASGFDPNGDARSVSSTVNVPAVAASGTKSVAAGPAAAAAAGTGSLARTGVDNVATMAWVAFGVLVLGGVLVSVATGRGRVRENA